VLPQSVAVETRPATAEPAVAEALSVSKRFGPTVALDDVTLSVRPGESHALVGRNGAGKSTLVAIMTGMLAADSGSVQFGGRAAPPLVDRSGWSLNVACVYQRSTIIPSLTVAENLFVNRQSTGPFISWRALNRRAAALLDEYQVRVDVSRPAGDLDVESRQMVEIARALSKGARFIILDEPTAQLDGAASARLFHRMRSLQASGVTFLFISHHLQEIHAVCETVTVLRDARHILTGPAAEVSHDRLVEAMTGEGRRTTGVWARSGAPDKAVPVLEVHGLELAGEFKEVSLKVRPGEIVGVTGSGSSGSTAFAQSLIGLRTPTSGRVEVAGAPLRLGNVTASLAAGIGYVPQERHKEGIIPLLAVGENITLPIADRLGRLGAISPGRQRAVADGMIDRLDIKTSGPEQPISALSGGNQQKAVMARALSNNPIVLVLIDPTAGVDVRSKESLLGVVTEEASAGRAVLMMTDDLADLRCCDRVLVMFRGEVVRELAAGWEEGEIVSAIEGIGTDRAH